MKNFYLTVLIVVIARFLPAQTTTTTTIYSSGDIATQLQSTNVTTATNSACPGNLTVNIPVNRYVTSIDVEYDMVASAITNAWINEQRSYLECVSTGLKEAAISTGTAGSNTPGTLNYNRTNLNIANGLVPAGGLVFKLHAFRVWGGNACNLNYQIIPSGTFKITVHHIPAPSCLPPGNLTINSASANSATLSWTSGGATNWQVEYGPSGFIPGTGTIVNTNTTPFALTGLNSSTSYDVRVRDSCGTGNVSFWSNTATFRTSCSVINAPWSEDFETIDWTAGIFGSIGSIDTCFSRNFNSNFTWEAGPPSFSSFGSGPAGDHTTGTGKYVFTQLSAFSPGGNNAVITTPQIDLSGLTQPEISYWYHMYGSDIGTLTVSISNNGGTSFTNLITKSGQQHIGKTAPWTEEILNLSAYSNDTIILKFAVFQPFYGTSGDVSIDDIDIHEQPTCPKPTNLSSISTSDGFILNWTSGGASNWQVEYGPKGFNPGSGNVVNVNTNPFTLTGLSPYTVYDIYVRDSCSATDLSNWSIPVTDTTLCSVYPTPFTENFDNNSWMPGIFWNDPGNIDGCWERSDTTNFIWKPGQNSTLTNFTGPDMDHTTGSGKYLYTDPVLGNATTTSINSPAFDLSTLSNPELRFWYHMYGSAIDRLEVAVWDGNAWSTVKTITGPQQNSSTEAWQEEIVSLAAYANDTIQVKIRGVRTSFGFYANMAIDDFWIGEAPSCPRPDNVLTTNTTPTSITLSWTTGGASNWLIGYRIAGSTTPLTIVAANTNPFTVNGLNPSTNYAFYVKDSCAANDVSLWEGPGFETTQCGVVTAPWAENFDGANWVSAGSFDNIGNQISSCWTRPAAVNPHFGTGTGPTQSVATGPNSDVSGNGNYLYTEASGPATGSGIITSPSIYLPANLSNPRLKFAYHMFGADIVDLKVKVNSGNGFNVVLSKTGGQHTSSSAAWSFDSVSLSNYAGDTIQIRLEGTNSGFNGDIAIDNIEIKGNAVSCPSPTAVSISNLTPTGATINWNTASGNSDIELVPAGQPQGSGTTYSNTSPPLVVQGLNPGTNYLIYLRNQCGTNLVSPWIIDSLVTPICPSVMADFGFTSNNLTANFNSLASHADSLFWDFGDGNSSNSPSPNHSYAGPGTYTVNFLAFNNCGNMDSINKIIVVCDLLVPNFSHSTNGDTIIFDASSTSGGSHYLWLFANTDTAQGQIVKYSFSTSGSKTISLLVINPCGDTASITRNITVCAAPQASWSYQLLGTNGSGMKVQFDGSSSINAAQYEWDFGDGNTTTGEVQPVHTYITPGLFYIVQLTVTNSCGDKHSMKYRLSQIGTEEIDISEGFEVYPNPATDYLYLEWQQSEIRPQHISIVDITGREVLQVVVQENWQGMAQIDLLNLKAGYYTLLLKSKLGYAQKKFLKN